MWLLHPSFMLAEVCCPQVEPISSSHTVRTLAAPDAFDGLKFLIFAFLLRATFI